MKYSLKSLTKKAQKEYCSDTADYMDIIKDMFMDGSDMMFVFNNMSRKDTLQVIDSLVLEDKNWYSNHRLLGDLYKIAITSLEARL